MGLDCWSRAIETLLGNTGMPVTTARDRNLSGYTIVKDVSDGARYKSWVCKDGVYYLYKENKKHTNGDYTYENYSEYIAMRIADAIGVSCVNIVLLDNAILSQVMSNKDLSSFIEYSEEFSHSFHMSNLSTYNISTLLNKNNNAYYSEVIDMLLFDALIGNSDRHPGNFMISEDGFYPLFDNGSSLCAFVEDGHIDDILRDTKRFEAMCTTKSKPVVRDNQRLTHRELVDIIKNQFPNEFHKFSLSVKHLDVDYIINGVSLSDNRKEMLKRFIKYRLEWFK